MILVTVVARVGCFALLGGWLPEPARDQEVYLRLAGSILDGQGLSFNTETGLLKHLAGDDGSLSGQWSADPGYVFGLSPVGSPSATVEPGYPAALALFMGVFGRVSGAVFLLNLLAQVLGAWAMYALGTRLSGRGAGLLAGLMFALYPYFVFYTANAMTEAVHSAMIPLILLASARSSDGGRGADIAPGAATGLLFLFRSTALFILPLQLWHSLRTRGLRGAAILLAGFALAVSPWVARNWIQLGSPVLLPTKGSLNMWMRNNPSALAEEGIEVPSWIPVRSSDLLEYPPGDRFVTELERSSELGRRSGLFMLRNPELMAWLSVERLSSYLSPVPATASAMSLPAVAAGVLVYVPIAALAGVGLWRNRRTRGYRLAAGLFIVYMVLHMMAHGGLRYRLPADTALMLLAAGTAGGRDAG